MDGDALQAGADRFRGFAGLYDDVRPVPPPELAALLVDYCGRRPRLVVDLGSGTGLSTRWAATWADAAVGVEPGDDMRATAGRQRDDMRATAGRQSDDMRATAGRRGDDTRAGRPADAPVRYMAGWSHDTGLAGGCADVVLAVQALHWMEPDATFREVARILRPGGVFAAVDCDWPPVVGDHVVEQAWDTCLHDIRVIETRLSAGLSGDALRAPIGDADRAASSYSGIDAHTNAQLIDRVRSWSKSGHLDRMSRSGLFEWCREIATTAAETGDADRFVGLLKSQGGYQTLHRHGIDDAELGVDRFESVVHARLGPDLRPWHFVYRARLAFAPG